MNKSGARELVWNELRKVALPDSRFHFDFNEYIPDFLGSPEATARLRALDVYQQAHVLFITPDNCLEQLREQALHDRKVALVTTYGIRRGVIELNPEDLQPGQEAQAALLDGMEKLGCSISLAQLRERYPTIDLLVTGCSAVSQAGVRFGKGHGFFDLEWAILFELGVVNTQTPVIAFVHDCQLVDIELEVSEFDTVCDFIVTPTRVISIPDAQKPTTGVLWDKLQPGMMENISLLREIKDLT
jgi:5-formyltetrahydrofolate cyclo-ligase